MRSVDEQLIELAASYYDDPVGFARDCFHWGEGDLVGFDGLDKWQEDFIRELGRQLVLGESGIPIPNDRLPEDEWDTQIRMAVASGHGTGKSAIISIIILWYLTTRPRSNIRVTANTEAQLRGTTWPELALWHKRCIFKEWFTWEATRFSKVGERENWYAESVAWNENNPDAFAGKHGRYYMLLMDEASGVADVIWETARGSITTDGNCHLALGNPIRPSGGFFDIFKHPEKSKRWSTRHINSLDTKTGNSGELRAIVREYGMDHDVTRRRVLGQFPRQAASQFISTELVERAIERRVDAHEYERFPVFIGVDVARFGDDRSCIFVRQGPKVLQIETIEGADTVQVANIAIGMMKRYDRDLGGVYVDSIGVGAGVYDIMKRYDERVHGIEVGRKPTNQKLYRNLRVELWDRVRTHLETADIPDHEGLKRELTQIEYDFTDLGQMRLERKVDMKARGLPSPDIADAYALSLARPEGVEFERFDDDDADWDAPMEYAGRSRITGY
jgi:hypothetical protein